jgi:hypothetical protein
MYADSISAAASKVKINFRKTRQYYKFPRLRPPARRALPGGQNKTVAGIAIKVV